jgi:hypothetical protein
MLLLSSRFDSTIQLASFTFESQAQLSVRFQLQPSRMSPRRSEITLAFSWGARSAFKLTESSYLKNMLSRRQLQGFVLPTLSD